MFPELLEIPFIHITVKSYGFMMVVGFCFAIFLVRKMARHIGEDPENAVNAALYALITGVVGSRIFLRHPQLQRYVRRQSAKRLCRMEGRSGTFRRRNTCHNLHSDLSLLPKTFHKKILRHALYRFDARFSIR